MTANSLSTLSTETQMISSVIVQNPAVTESFCLMQLSEQGSLHQRELQYHGPGIQSGEEAQRFHFQWSDDVLKLEKRSKEHNRDIGRSPPDKNQKADLQMIYQGKFRPSILLFHVLIHCRTLRCQGPHCKARTRRGRERTSL